VTRARIPSPSPSIDDVRIDLAVDLAVDRLAVEFDDRAETQTVLDVVRTCRADLSGVPATALPELVERLARHRLLATVGC
jgi:hypothetical protein